MIGSERSRASRKKNQNKNDRRCEEKKGEIHPACPLGTDITLRSIRTAILRRSEGRRKPSIFMLQRSGYINH